MVHEFTFADGTARPVEVFDVPLAFLTRVAHEDYPRVRVSGTRYDGYEHLGEYVLVTARVSSGVPDYEIALWKPCQQIESCGLYLEGWLKSRLPINEDFERLICEALNVPYEYETYYEVWHVVCDLVDDVEVFDVLRDFVRASLVMDGFEYYDNKYVPYGFGRGFGGISTGTDYVMRDYYTGEPWPCVSAGYYLVVMTFSRFGTVNRVTLLDCCRTLSDAYDCVGYERIQERAFYGGWFEVEEGHTWCSTFEIWHVVTEDPVFDPMPEGLLEMPTRNGLAVV